jgi:sec-independent protein translocase protein TatC
VASPLRRLNPFRSDRRKWGRRHNPDGTMTLVDHLYELRYRLGVALLAVVLGAVFGFWWFSHSWLGVPMLSDIMKAPYCQLPANTRFSPNGTCQLLQTKPFESFMIQLKVGVAIGAVVLSPVWLYQLWAFITPGLHLRERKHARTFVVAASLLFVGGAVLAYFVVPEGLGFLATFGGDAFFMALSGSDYINFVLLMLVIFGVSFELPLVLVMLNRAGVVSYAKLKGWWRGIVFALFIFAAIATPGQDPVSMLALAVTLSLLFGASLVICRSQDRRKAKRLQGQGLAGLDLDEASDLDTAGSPLDTTSSGAKGHDDAT